ncbi:sulfotransferase [Altererythrobacter lutimaris]|uniref:Sulfotransferase n=1 Tax=Altererythrobacter lutimaris TaxID=2743979 RepID=A0A850HGD8_9SPHN|nr:sulfotransferase [Altererythrobacter lutimaris]NVE93762.1 sulfotransferase [Altererythrobacter lutimaris]
MSSTKSLLRSINFRKIMGESLHQSLIETVAKRDTWTPEPGQVRWLFIATFNNGGSTALGELLDTASAAMRLVDDGEGQWLMPQLHAPGRRWNADAVVDYKLVRGMWLREVRKVGGFPKLVVEKSPGNMVRMRPLLETFSDMPCTVIRLTRDPYAVCASWAKRYSLEHLEKFWDEDVAGVETKSLDHYRLLGDIYGRRAKLLLGLEDVTQMALTYEELTENPREVLDRLAELEPLLHDADREAKLRVKDYEPRPLENMNARQISKLTPEQVAAISAGLEPHAEAVSALGYDFR